MGKSSAQDPRCHIKISAKDGETDIVFYNSKVDPIANRRRLAIEAHQALLSNQDLYLTKEVWDE